MSSSGKKQETPKNSTSLDELAKSKPKTPVEDLISDSKVSLDTLSREKFSASYNKKQAVVEESSSEEEEEEDEGDEGDEGEDEGDEEESSSESEEEVQSLIPPRKRTDEVKTASVGKTRAKRETSSSEEEVKPSKEVAKSKTRKDSTSEEAKSKSKSSKEVAKSKTRKDSTSEEVKPKSKTRKDSSSEEVVKPSKNKPSSKTRKDSSSEEEVKPKSKPKEVAKSKTRKGSSEEEVKPKSKPKEVAKPKARKDSSEEEVKPSKSKARKDSSEEEVTLSKNWKELIKQDVNEPDSIYQTRYLITGLVDDTSIETKEGFEGSEGEASITLGRQITNKFWYGLTYDPYLEALITRFLESSNELSTFLEKAPKKEEPVSSSEKESSSDEKETTSSKETTGSSSDEKETTGSSSDQEVTVHTTLEEIPTEGSVARTTSIEDEKFVKEEATPEDVASLEKLSLEPKPVLNGDKLEEDVAEQMREVYESEQGENRADPNPEYVI